MTHAIAHHHDHHDSDSMDIFGFWLYIMSDCILFSIIFATYAVLYKNVYGGPSIGSLTDMSYVLTETMALLASSFTFGMSILSAYKNKTKNVIFWLMITFALGATFIGMEVNEFIHLCAEGHSWSASAAMSAFFTLVGTHGLHVFSGLLWMVVMLLQVSMFGLTSAVQRRLTYLGLFWAFLDIVWIFVYTVVYLMGSV